MRRQRLVDTLCDPLAPPLVLLVAPAGYGKTTLLREWAAHDDRPFAWLALDSRDNDPSRLLASIARAVDRVRPSGSDAPFVLVLDDAHVLDRAAARQVLASVADELPPGAAVAFAARREPALGVARLRAQQIIAEIGSRELALTLAETVTLFRSAGVELDRDAVVLLLRRTEGWPVGLSLAALSLGRRPTAAAVARFGGGERIVADYVRDEVLAELSPRLLRFLRETSILDMLTGPLCDAALNRSRSGAALAELAGSGAMIVPLDRSGERYRHHRLLAEALSAELRRNEPELERDLHRRASAWHRLNGNVELAVRHAYAAGDVDAAGELVWTSVGTCFTHGRKGAVDRWLDQFSHDQQASDRGLCLVTAGRHLIRGDGHLAEQWVARAAAAPSAGCVSEGALAVLRAAAGSDGIARMGEDAASASALLPDDSPWRAVAALLRGVAEQLGGAPGGGGDQLEDGAHRAAVRAPNVHALCLTQLAARALEADDWDHAEELSARARAQVHRHALADDATMAIVFAVSSVVRGRRGRIDGARSDAERAWTLKSRLTDFAPWYEIELRVMLARSALRLGDVNVARDELAAAARLLRRAPGTPVLKRWVREAMEQLEAFDADDGPAPCLTAAELRILGFLPTHLSFREIAERTYVSTNTVKTQANAVYRKLDASCRSGAVARAAALGMLDTRASAGATVF